MYEKLTNILDFWFGLGMLVLSTGFAAAGRTNAAAVGYASNVYLIFYTFIMAVISLALSLV